MQRMSLLFVCAALSASASAAERIAGPLILEQAQHGPLGLYAVAIPQNAAGRVAWEKAPVLANPQPFSADRYLWADLDAVLAQPGLDQVVLPAEGQRGPITRLDAPDRCLDRGMGAGTPVFWVDQHAQPCSVWENVGDGRVYSATDSVDKYWLTYERHPSREGYLAAWKSPFAPDVPRIRTDLMVELEP